MSYLALLGVPLTGAALGAYLGYAGGVVLAYKLVTTIGLRSLAK